MKTKILFISIIAFLSMNAFSQQVSIAPKVGLNIANFAGDVYDNTTRLRTQIGGILNVGMNDNISIQPGLLLSGKGCTLDLGDDDKDAITLDYLEVPFTGVLKLELNSAEDLDFQIFAGPYLGFCISGKYKYLADEDNEVESLLIGNSEDDEVKPLDVGVNIGIGVLIQDLQIQLGYSTSLASINAYDNEILKNSVISISFAYFIEL